MRVASVVGFQTTEAKRDSMVAVPMGYKVKTTRGVTKLARKFRRLPNSVSLPAG